MQASQEASRDASRRGWLVLGLCLALLAALVAIVVFGVAVSTVLLFGMVLLCPLLHLFMGHGHAHGTGTAEHAEHGRTEQPTNRTSRS